MSLNTHTPPKKTRYCNPVVIYDLETRKWSEYKSTNLAARSLDTASATLLTAIRQRKPAKQRWLVAYKEDKDKLKKSLSYYQKHYDYCVRQIQAPENARNKQCKVQLRIDNRTVIYVDSWNANEKYAEQYMQRLKKSNR